MPIFNLRKLFGDDVAKVLEPGESLVDLGHLHQPLGGDDSKLELEDHELSRLERKYLAEHGHRLETSDAFFQGVDWTGVHTNPDRVTRALFGLSGRGAPGSSAGQLWRAGRAAGSMLEWAVTDRRLLILTSDIAQDKTYTIRYAVPRSSITSAVRRGKLLFQWGRVELTFRDGSMLAWTLAMLDIGAARKLVDALSAQ